MKRLMGDKNQTSPFDPKGSGGRVAAADSTPGDPDETREQHDHSLNTNPDAQPITSSTTHTDDDD